MSQADFDRALERMATDPNFASSVRANSVGALAEYDLTDRQRQDLALMQTSAVAGTPAPAALATRRSKSSMLGIGAVAGVVAVGTATFGTIHYLNPSSSYSQFMSLDSGGETGVYSITQGVNTGGAGIGSATGLPRTAYSFTVVRPQDTLSAKIREDISRGVIVGTITFRIQSGGKDYRHIILTHVVFTNDEVASATSSDGRLHETVKLVAEHEQITYP